MHFPKITNIEKWGEANGDSGGARYDLRNPDLPEEHAGGGLRRGDLSEQKFSMKTIGIVGVSLMISYCLATSARRSGLRMGAPPSGVM